MKAYKLLGPVATRATLAGLHACKTGYSDAIANDCIQENTNAQLNSNV